MSFLRARLNTTPVPVPPPELTPLEKARQEFDAAAARVEAKHKEIKDKEILFKRLLAEAPQDALVFDALQLELARKKAAFHHLGGSI